MEKQSIYEKRINKIKESEEYIIWLDKYSEKNTYFTNDQYQYTKSFMKEEDIENTECLRELYAIINEYAENNYISAFKDELGYYYKISYNSNSYKIGYMEVEDIIYYCSKINEINDNTIDFVDILQNKKTKSAEIIKLKMFKLELIVEELSLTLPEEMINKKIRKIYQKKNNYRKI